MRELERRRSGREHHFARWLKTSRHNCPLSILHRIRRLGDLAEMQRTGVFGMKGEIRPALVTARSIRSRRWQIDNDILEDKWA